MIRIVCKVRKVYRRRRVQHFDVLHVRHADRRGRTRAPVRDLPRPDDLVTAGAYRRLFVRVTHRQAAGAAAVGRDRNPADRGPPCHRWLQARRQGVACVFHIHREIYLVGLAPQFVYHLDARRSVAPDVRGRPRPQHPREYQAVLRARVLHVIVLAAHVHRRAVFPRRVACQQQVVFVVRAQDRNVCRAHDLRRQLVLDLDVAPAYVAPDEVHHPVGVCLADVVRIHDRRNPWPVAVWRHFVQLHFIVVVTEVRAFQHVVRQYLFFAVGVQRQVQKVVAHHRRRSTHHLHKLHDHLLATRIGQRRRIRPAHYLAVHPDERCGRARVERRRHFVRPYAQLKGVERRRRNSVHRDRGHRPARSVVLAYRDRERRR
ncbi:MAG: hypothetical protein PGMFKBFP_02401 [Anaerolineales bacterium]|nr:hypothetical protein [Anaerolineales bacterium]